jgi:predicted Zn-dependent protease
MWHALAAALVSLPLAAAAQPVLEFPSPRAFSAAEVDALAARAYGARLRTLAQVGRLDPEPALKARLQRILPRLLAAAAYEKPASAQLAWEVHACTGCDENAAAMAGGKLLVSADFVARLELSDDELAYLLAHEIGHVLAEHTREYASAARYFVDNGLARSYGDIQQELNESVPVNLRMAVLGEQQELEADRIGFVLGSRAGAQPRAMLTLLAKLGDTGGFLGSHPGAQRRLAQARSMLETARRLSASSLAPSAGKGPARE